MHQVIDVSKQQLKLLDGETLRELVARLCEAELTKTGAPISAVRWSGAHTASDGGLDVDCRVESEPFRGDFVPCARTGFQVKKSSMPAGEIAKEMSPRGQLRPIFAELAKSDGCYIIVSLEDDPTPNGKPLAARRHAMREQVAGLQDLGDLRTEFYGRHQLAQWLRRHPGVEHWARERLGIPLPGWKSFGRWTRTLPGDNDSLICGSGVSVVLPGQEAEKLEIKDGIQGIRQLVRSSGKAVRIVGLSGVGKTRIVQALFEHTVGTNPLDSTLAVYADLGEEPDPSARVMLERLRAEGHSGIVVLDNCPPNTHNSLADFVADLTDLRLITVEYDIRDDRTERTAVVRIDAEGPEIVEALVRRRCPDRGQIDARRIAEFSGGNARLALALAAAVDDTESLSDFSDSELFDRLFYQRGGLDQRLLEAAEVLSLVYSFSISSDHQGVDELAVMASIIGQNRRALYRDAQTLVERQLAQKRGHWRAVLPPAVSNRLASKALNAISADDILDSLLNLPAPRLLISFGKRLGYLHEHEVAREIIAAWLAPGGLLHEIEHLGDPGLRLLTNLAPVDPNAILRTIEARIGTLDVDHPGSIGALQTSVIAELLCAIAYDANLFERSVNLLAKIALSKKEAEGPTDSRDRLSALFSLYLSGTLAGLDTRVRIVRDYLFSANRRERELGFRMLEAALKRNRHAPLRQFDFGARPRSYGYFPGSHEERDQWFRHFVDMAREAATGEDLGLAKRSRVLLANQLQSLWHIPTLRSDLIAVSKTLHDQRPWLEGWRAVRSIKHGLRSKSQNEAKPFDPELLDQLDDLLKPARLADSIRSYILTPDQHRFALDNEFDKDDEWKWETSRRRASDRAFELGETAALDPEVIDELAGELYTTLAGCLQDFGKGLASNCPDPHGLWIRLIEHLERAGEDARNWQVLCGYLQGIGERDRSLAEDILDHALENSSLRRFLVELQTSVALDRRGVERLLKSLDFDDTPLDHFGYPAWHRPLDALNETYLLDLMLKVIARPGGAGIVLGGLHMRFHILKENCASVPSTDIKRVGLCTAAQIFREFIGPESAMMDHQLSTVLETCMDDNEFPIETDEILDSFVTGLQGSHGYLGDLNETVAVLAAKAPLRFLDRVLLGENLNDYHHSILFRDALVGRNPLCGIAPATLLDWCRQGNFQERLLRISEAISPFEEEKDGDVVDFSEQAHAVIDEVQDVSAVLTSFASSTSLGHGQGWLSDTIARRIQPFEALLLDTRPQVRQAAEALVPQLRKFEHRERQREQDEERQRDQSFE